MTAEDTEGAAVAVTRPDGDPSVLVKDPATLTVLEEPYAFAKIIGTTGTTGAELAAASPVYRSMVQAVTDEVEGLKRADRTAAYGFATSRRLFNEKWIASPEVRLELTGIANRIDLKHRGGCGEVHFVYRLAYTTQPGGPDTRIDSRLPFTANVIVEIPDDGSRCSSVAGKWLGVAKASPVETARSLLAGPLAGLPGAARLEFNFQLVRSPSRAREDMGGHADYVLRAFRITPTGLEASPLDDTPRTDLDPTAKAALKKWIGDNLAAIDQGSATVPAELGGTKILATSVKSVAPRPSSRVSNQPFSALFDDADFASLPLAGTATVKTPAALLHKLDGITCQGCHQSRGIAGFHLLGEERLGTARLNALAVGASPHLLDAMTWRKQFLLAVGGRSTPPNRLAADRAADRPGRYGDHCTLGKDAGFAEWSCKDGLTCQRVDDDLLGRCLEPGVRKLGDACEDSKVTSSLVSENDRVSTRVLQCAEGAACQRSASGFPDGMCQKRCEAVGKAIDEDRMCAGVPWGSGELGGFNECLFTRKLPFLTCLADDQRPTTVRACDENNPCRDDFTCGRIYVKGDRFEPAKGACVPPYFVFQGRVDGHVLKLAN